jgi:hypothetical protein
VFWANYYRKTDCTEVEFEPPESRIIGKFGIPWSHTGTKFPITLVSWQLLLNGHFAGYCFHSLPTWTWPLASLPQPEGEGRTQCAQQIAKISESHCAKSASGRIIRASSPSVPYNLFRTLSSNAQARIHRSTDLKVEHSWRFLPMLRRGEPH